MNKFNTESSCFCYDTKIEQRNNFSFAKNTTYGCGGTAKCALYPKNIPQAKLAYNIASKGKFTILGNGSNVLASDNFYDGTIISTKKLEGIYKVNKNTLCVLAGTKISTLVNYCVKNQFGGLEYLYGIPASVGGAAYMNAGSDGKYFCNNIFKVRVYDGKCWDLSNSECKFEYKQSTMRDIKAIILAIFIKIMPNCDKNLLTDKINERIKFRAELPKGKSCGCVFKNIGGLSAGKIIQNCGLANASYGNAKISDKHCNFIINYGSSSKDVKKLIDIVKTEVYKKTLYKLEEEVIYIGDFNDFNG